MSGYVPVNAGAHGGQRSQISWGWRQIVLSQPVYLLSMELQLCPSEVQGFISTRSSPRP